MFDKLLNELSSLGVTKDSDLLCEKSQNALKECQYLDYIIKETLRFDNPATATLERIVKEDIVIWGVPILKGTIAKMSFLSTLIIIYK